MTISETRFLPERENPNNSSLHQVSSFCDKPGFWFVHPELETLEYSK